MRQTYRPFYQGLFPCAPYRWRSDEKHLYCFAHVFSQMGYRVMPETNDKRYDIIQAIEFNNRGTLLFILPCHTKMRPPVDCHGNTGAVGNAWIYPRGGNGCRHIRTGGLHRNCRRTRRCVNRILVYLQGSLTYAHGRIACMMAVDATDYFDNQQ